MDKHGLINTKLHLSLALALGYRVWSHVERARPIFLQLPKFMFLNKNNNPYMLSNMFCHSGKAFFLCGWCRKFDSLAFQNNFTWPFRGHVVTSELATC